MNSGFVDGSDQRWHDVKQVSQHDFYHLPEYVRLDAELVGGTPVCWFYQGEDLRAWIPLIKRSIPDHITKGKDYFDLSSPYGYSGILFDKPAEPESLNSIIRMYKDDAADSGYVSSFLRMNPITNPYTWQQDEQIEQVYHGFTITVPLDTDIETIRSNYSANHRKNIRQLQDNGFAFSMEGECRNNEFIIIYEETMDRLEAKDYYYFPRDYFNSLFDILDGRIHLALVYAPNGEIAAGGLLTDFNGIIQSHLTATRTACLAHAPSKLLFDGVIQWATNSGRKWLHLGGGLNSKEDTLYRFKKGFSPIKNQFSTLRIIHDKERYNNLTYIALKECGKQEFSNERFFPLYRYD